MAELRDPAKYDGQGAEIFRLALWTGFLTLITLGIYRFWGKTRIRRYIWSHASLDGARFEYTGTGLEKLLGFLVAVVVLAVYLAVVQLILFSLGMRFVVRPQRPEEVLGQLALIYSTVFALAPLMFFAGYRAHRYKLLRTRLRGIRFGMEKAAWGYTWRACLYLLATILTLGILQPLMRFRLEQYWADRTWYGDAQMAQGGKWTGLYGPMKHIFIGIGVMILAGAIAAAGRSGALFGAALGIAGYIWVLVGVVSYWVQGTAYLTRNKQLRLAGGGVVGLDMQLRTSSVIGYYVGGGLAVGLIVAMIGIVLRVAALGLRDEVAGVPPVVLGVAGAVVYLAVLTLISALTLAFIRQPILGYFIGQTMVVGSDGLATVRQRAGEAGADADGFAEALDLGGAF